MLAVIRQHAEQEPGRARRRFRTSCGRSSAGCCSKSPRGRPQTAQQVATLLDALAPELLQYPVAQRLTAPPSPAASQQMFTTQAAMPRGPGPTPLPHPLAPMGGLPVTKKKGHKALLVAALVVLLAVGGTVAFAALRPADQAGDKGTDSSEAGATQVNEPDPATTAVTTTTEAELTTAPDLVGMDLSEAQDQLPATMEVEIVDSIQQGAEPGTVVEQSPKAGESLNGKISLTVAREAVQVYLDEFPPVNGSWASADATAAIAGKQYLHSLSAHVGGCDSGGEAEYNLSKGFRRLTATSAVDDNANNSEITAQLEIFADGRESREFETIAYGKATPIDVDLSGVLGLEDPVGAPCRSPASTAEIWHSASRHSSGCPVRCRPPR